MKIPGRNGDGRTTPLIRTALFAMLLGLAWPSIRIAGQANDAASGEWRHHEGDLTGSKYSTLAQINGSNFSTLRLAWRWESADALLDWTDSAGTWRVSSERVFDLLESLEPKRWVTRPRIAAFEATPLMVKGVVYVTTALYQAAAIDATTGKTLWVFDPKAYVSGTPALAPWRNRGAAYWDGANGAARVLWGTGDGYLLAVDAKTGRPIPEFGRGGRIDLMEGLPRASRGRRDGLNLLPVSQQSPPIVVGGTVIVGSSINDYPTTKEMPPGWVRAYDVRTGRHKWDFRTVPLTGEFGSDTWLNDSQSYSGNTNVWSLMSADEELGYVYLPVGTPTSDYYGGHRPGDGLFGESLVCVNVETGKRVWHFQFVHHGIWDYDLPAAPNLMDIKVDGQLIKAVAQVTKQGFVYTFDRVTGKPVWPIEERPVPVDTDLLGERLSATQPFPTKPPAFEYQGTSLDDLVDFTPAVRQMALEVVKPFRLGPLYTPNSLQGTLFRPTVIGGANWGGAASDPETGMLYVPSHGGSSFIKYRESASPKETLRYVAQPTNVGPAMPNGLPLWKPPYGRITAIDMNRGEQAWMVPGGDGDIVRNHPMLRDLHLAPVGGDNGRNGPLLTKTLLIVTLNAGGTGNKPRLVAYDKASGQELGSVDLPNVANGNPMTYMVNGKQYLAVTVGGAIPSLVAFSLP